MWLLTLQCILVASDLGERSLLAVRTAARLAHLADARLHLLHVAADAEPTGGSATLREQARSVAGIAPVATARVVVGSPAAAIVEQAMGLGADVIVFGPHRPDREGGGRLGSTAVDVIQTAPCPCLIAAGDLHLPLDRVIVPTDTSEAARGAVAVGLSWASALRPPGGEAELVVLHVLTGEAGPGAEARLRSDVDRAREMAGGAARVRVREVLAEAPEPAAEILRRAGDPGTDLLVMGTHGHTGESDRLGSVSSAVARAALKPLLLVPPDVRRARADA